VISHFSAVDFLEVIDRCERLGVQIIGIETFSSNVELPDIEIAPGPGLDFPSIREEVPHRVPM
jgi:hypothetical protein